MPAIIDAFEVLGDDQLDVATGGSCFCSLIDVAVSVVEPIARNLAHEYLPDSIARAITG